MDKKMIKQYEKLIVETLTDDICIVLDEKDNILYQNKDIDIKELKYDSEKGYYHDLINDKWYIKRAKKFCIDNENDMGFERNKVYQFWKYCDVVTFKKREEKLQKDDKTGVLRYSTFKEKLEIAHTYNRHIVLAILDIDHFKEINDKFGHDYGDKVLVEYAKVMKKLLRKSDLVGRFGGDEFIIALTSTTIEKAKIILNKLSKEISKIKIDGKLAKCQFSMGVSTYIEDTFENNFSRVDEALYYSKKNGRNKITYLEK